MFDRVLRAGEGRKLKALKGLVPDITAYEAEYEKLSDDQLRAKTPEFRQRLDNGEDLDDLLIEGFAVVREGARRVIGQRHYDVQLMGGAALHFGWVAEMRTGEGKTLVSTLPVYLNGVAGKGVHVVTVNDYLATRDAEWMGQVHNWLGVSVGLIVPGQRDSAYKREQYNCDVTYGTNNELGFDYLRDNMATNKSRKVQRGHSFCIVDEIDSILIDEARTPLIISGKASQAAELYVQFAQICRSLKRDVDYEVDEEKRTVSPTEEGIESVERALGVENIYDGVSSNLVHQLSAALRAKELFKRDKDYIIADGEVRIVDEFTGRVLEGRRWSEGLHQAVEAKEGVKIKEENQTLATITLQNYFRLYDKLAGMTGTAESEAAELASTYDLQVVPIPTNRPIARVDQADLIYKTEEAKFNAVIDDLETRHAEGQPVLVGTASVEKSEALSKLMAQRGIRHEVLNAKQHTREADIVVQAGRIGGITVATNMAGRGVDIILGGNAEGAAEAETRAEGLDPEDGAEGQARFDELLVKYDAEYSAEGEKVKALGGLYVLGTERHESRRIDNQLRGRSGRQGDPGESRFYLSLEDDLMRIFATGAMNWVMDRALPEDVPIEAKMVTKAIERAQNTVEQRNAEIRKNVLKYDEVMNEQRKVVYQRRDQILDDADLRDESMQYLAEAVDGVISTHCVSDYQEEWDLSGLHTDIANYWDSEVSEEALEAAGSTDELYDLLMAEATAHYEDREEEIGAEAMREVERQVMLSILDQHWREHLYEMDYLKEGINLRAMGQKDPLTEWQREGYDMFGEMMGSVAQDFVRHIMHVNVVVEEAPAPGQAAAGQPAPAPAGETLEDSVKPDAGIDPGPGISSTAAAAAPPKVTAGTGAAPVLDDEVDGEVTDVSYSASDSPTRPVGGQQVSADVDAPPTANQPSQAQVVKSEEERTPRNAPCHCGSGKKFKQCHGRR
jgi:preprotein translocase subunit SecA